MWQALLSKDLSSAMSVLPRLSPSDHTTAISDLGIHLTLVDLASWSGFSEILEPLATAFPSAERTSLPLEIAAFAGNSQCIRVLCQLGFPFHTPSRGLRSHRTTDLGISVETKRVSLSPDRMTAWTDYWGFESISAPGLAAKTGAWYYEIQLIEAELYQLGWATPETLFNPSGEEGVGDTKDSFAVDGCRLRAWTAERNRRYGESWNRGDIVGCFVDLERRFIGFSLNGKYLGDAFTDIPQFSRGICPAMTIDKFQRISFNFGLTPFKFPPLPPFRPVIFSRVTPDILRVAPLHLLATLPPDCSPDATALHWAAQKNNVEVIGMLLSAFREQTTKVLYDATGDNPVCFAAATNATAAIEALMRVEIDAEIRADVCGLALWACYVNRSEESASVLSRLALPTCHLDLDDLGRNPLHAISAYGLPGILSQFLSRTPSSAEYVNACDRHGWTPLMFACHNGKVDCAKLLLDHGADPTPSEDPLIRGLRQPILAAVTNSDTRCLELLLDRGVSPNFLGSYDMTPLMHSCFNYYINSVRILVAKGADVNMKSRRGKTGE